MSGFGGDINRPDPQGHIGFTMSYKNFAALDGLAQKVLDLRMKQYSDNGKGQQVIDKKVQNARGGTNLLTRESALK